MISDLGRTNFVSYEFEHTQRGEEFGLQALKVPKFLDTNQCLLGIWGISERATQAAAAAKQQNDEVALLFKPSKQNLDDRNVSPAQRVDKRLALKKRTSLP